MRDDVISDNYYICWKKVLNSMFFLMSGDFKICYCCQFDKIKLFDSCIKNTTSAVWSI